jgi:oligoendopeptidase F
MSTALPENPLDFMSWTWPQIEPHYQALAERPIDPENVSAWLADWSHLAELLSETGQRLYVATTVDTTDEQAKKRQEAFLDRIFPKMEAANQKLKEKLLASGLQPPGFEIPLRNMRAEAEIFREANLPLIAQEIKLSNECDRLYGAQTVSWEGKETTIRQLLPVFQDQDRQKRESAWRLESERQLADRSAFNELWGQLMSLRGKMATNAGFADYRAFRWRQLQRFDYAPADCIRFHEAIEQVVVPAVERLHERRRRMLGIETLRPWDLDVDPEGRPLLRSFETVERLESGVSSIFRRVDPQLAAYFETMRREHLLDLDNRKGKAPGGYCTDFQASHRPFIFMNAVGIHDDVQTLLHEGGHSFHVFETNALPYIHQRAITNEIAEVASMSMELIAAPYLAASQGGFYSEKDAARVRIEYLEDAIRFWPYMAVVDAFQHWAYENHQAASDPVNCDAKWDELWGHFMPGVDWSDLEAARVTGWQRKPHILQVPFYYIEYGLAQLGAFQVWRNSLKDQAGATAAYRRALALGGTRPLPKLFSAAGARLAFDAQALREAIDLGEQTIAYLDARYA